jgi:hypothetical protein
MSGRGHVRERGDGTAGGVGGDAAGRICDFAGFGDVSLCACVVLVLAVAAAASLLR